MPRKTFCVARTGTAPELLDDMADRREHVVVTRHGLSDAETLAAIDAGLRDIERGETVTLAQLRRDTHRRSH